MSSGDLLERVSDLATRNEAQNDADGPAYRHSDQECPAQRRGRAVHNLMEADCALRRERDGSRSGERLREPRQHAEVGMQRDPLQPAHP